jgi:uncharacterized membrane protein
MSFACANYMVAYGMQKWRNSVTILYPEGFTFVICWAIYHLTQKRGEVKVYQEKGLKPYLYVILRGLIAVIIPANIALMTFICREWVGVSPAVIQSFSSMSAFTTALLFYVAYNEKLTRQHILGMFLIVLSVMIVSICKTMSVQTISDTYD